MKPIALVIENDAGTRRLLAVLLSRVGIDVDLATTGTDALIALQNVQYDVVLIDLLLPGKSGNEILQWMAQDRPHLLRRAVVVSSAPLSQLEAVSARWDVPVIRKPFELGDVLEAAQSIVAQRERREQTAAEKFCRHSMRAGAKAGIVVARVNNTLQPVLWYGYTKELIDAYFPLPLDAPYPLTAAVRHGKPVWLASLTLAAPEYPALATVWEKNESRALAVVPLMQGGQVIGAAGWSFRQPRHFSETEKPLFAEIAEALPDWLELNEQSATTATA